MSRILQPELRADAFVPLVRLLQRIEFDLGTVVFLELRRYVAQKLDNREA